MEIIGERFDDAGERDENGHYDYSYAGVVYLLHEGDFRCKARSYDDEPTRVSILTVEIGGQKLSGEQFIAELTMETLSNGARFQPLFDALRRKGHKEFFILTDAGYASIESSHPEGA